MRPAIDCGVFLDLTEEGEHRLEPYDDILRDEAARLVRTATHIRVQISDLHAGSFEEVASILEVTEKYLSAHEAVYLYCWGGHGRTGMVVGCYLVQQLRPDQALNRLAQLHQEMSDGWIPSPQSEEQRQMALNWKCR
jgi:protein-tyrosine phosphatase